MRFAWRYKDGVVAYTKPCSLPSVLHELFSLSPTALITLPLYTRICAKHTHPIANMVHLPLPTLVGLVLAATAALASSSDILPKLHSPSLEKRQSGAFVPGTTHGNGNTCVDAFGPGFVSCGTGIECVNPAEGQTCCSGGCTFPFLSFLLRSIPLSAPPTSPFNARLPP